MLWHMPHGIDLLATLKNNYSYYLLCQQPSPARIHSFMQRPFFIAANTFQAGITLSTASAPSSNLLHLLKGALPLTKARSN